MYCICFLVCKMGITTSTLQMTNWFSEELDTIPRTTPGRGTNAPPNKHLHVPKNCPNPLGYIVPGTTPNTWHPTLGHSFLIKKRRPTDSIQGATCPLLFLCLHYKLYSFRIQQMFQHYLKSPIIFSIPGGGERRGKRGRMLTKGSLWCWISLRVEAQAEDVATAQSQWKRHFVSNGGEG